MNEHKYTAKLSATTNNDGTPECGDYNAGC